MTNRNYETPTVQSEWASSRETDMAVAVAIHAIADSTRSPEAIWEAPTNAEWDHVKMAVQEYVAHGDFPADPSGYSWGQETIRFWDAIVEINGDPTNRCTVGELFRVNDGIDPSERAEIVAALRDHGEYRGGGGASAEYVLRTIEAKP